MSADNWTVCPQCKAKADADYKRTVEAVNAKYGKIPVEEFEKLRAEIKSPPTRMDTLREDYEIGMDSKGEFGVVYQCSCECGFIFRFKHHASHPRLTVDAWNRRDPADAALAAYNHLADEASRYKSELADARAAIARRQPVVDAAVAFCSKGSGMMAVEAVVVAVEGYQESNKTKENP